MYTDVVFQADRGSRKRPLRVDDANKERRSRYSTHKAAGLCIRCSKPRCNLSEHYCEFHYKKNKWWLYRKKPTVEDTDEEGEAPLDPNIIDEQRYLRQLLKNERH